MTFRLLFRLLTRGNSQKNAIGPEILHYEFEFSITELKETQRSMKIKRSMKIVPPSRKEQKVDPMVNYLLKRFS